MPEGVAPAHEPSADRSTTGLPSWHLLAGSPLYDNPALYDLVHRGYRGDVDWYRQAVGTTPALVIDLGCGTGRVAIPLSDDGHRVIAIDASEPMLDLLRTRVTPRHTIGVLAADVRSLTLDVQADVVLAACNFLGHFTRAERCDLLRRCADWLRPGGRLLLDIADAPWHRAHPNLLRSVPHHADVGVSFVVTASSTLDDDRVSVAFAVHLADAAGTHREQLVDGVVSMWLIDAQELIQDLAAASFKVSECLPAFSPDEAEAGGHRVVIQARRADRLA